MLDSVGVSPFIGTASEHPLQLMTFRIPVKPSPLLVQAGLRGDDQKTKKLTAKTRIASPPATNKISEYVRSLRNEGT